MSSSRIHQLLNAPEGKEIPFWLSQPRQSSRGSGGKEKANGLRNSVLARALREIGCLERTLFILHWISRSGAQGPFQRRAPDAFFWTYRAWRTSWFQ